MRTKQTRLTAQKEKIHLAWQLVKSVMEELKNDECFRDEYPITSRTEILRRLDGIAMYIEEMQRLEGELK